MPSGSSVHINPVPSEIENVVPEAADNNPPVITPVLNTVLLSYNGRVLIVTSVDANSIVFGVLKSIVTVSALSLIVSVNITSSILTAPVVSLILIPRLLVPSTITKSEGGTATMLLIRTGVLPRITPAPPVSINKGIAALLSVDVSI